MSVLEVTDCTLCNADQRVQDIITACRLNGWGYKKTYRTLRSEGYSIGRDQVQLHLQHQMRTVMSSIADAEDAGIEVDDNFFARHGIELPPEGTVWVAGTVEQRGPDGEKHWIRIKPESLEVPEDERIEIRQAQPVEVIGRRPSLTIVSPGDWQTWVASPDAQIGYWIGSDGFWHTTHDERCFDLGHQIALALADDGGVHGWLDVGDLADLQAFSRHHPTGIDLHVKAINHTWQRIAEEFAWRRWLVGPLGELVVTAGNHDIRLRTKAQSNDMPYLVGMRRAGDPEDEFPVLSVPYMTRAKDYGVEWMTSFPTGYRRLNSNLYAFHSPAYGSRALDTSRKIAAKVHASVIFGHTHRRESLAENIETSKGNRTMEVWSDGTWARADGSVPSERNTFNDAGNRLLVDELPESWGLLSENWHSGMSVIHVEIGGRERFSVERIAFWDGWANFRGQGFETSVDADGNDRTQLVEAA